MKKLLIILMLLFGLHATAQQASPVRPTLDERSVVKDSTGFVYPYAIWKKLFQSGSYGMRTVQKKGADFEFLLYELSQSERAKRMEAQPKPPESTSFKTGRKLSNFKFTDLQGQKFNLKELAGKVIVLNFWFINCGPCRIEIPELNKMVAKYKGNPNVVFLAIGLDSKSEIKDFLKKSPFLYNITENGSYLAKFYGVQSYPTHVVIDQSANVVFHTAGLAQNTVYWIDKSIASALDQVEAVSTQIK